MPITQVIAPLVNIPSTGEPATFSEKADAFLADDLPERFAQMNTWATQANQLAASMNAAAAGGAMSIIYQFSTSTTDADPGDGKLRLNQAAQNTATQIFADLLDAAGSDWTSALDLFDDSTSSVKGYIKLTQTDDGSKWLLFAVTGLTSASGYRKIAVSVAANSATSPFANGASVELEFTRTGDKGDLGTYADVVAFDPSGTDLSSTDVQGAIEELDARFSALLTDAMVFKGAINASTNPNYPAADAGHTYRISAAGKVGGSSGKAVEIGDLLTCIQDGSAAGNEAAVGSRWLVFQANIDGAVIGPTNASNNSPVVFNGMTGKLVKETSYDQFLTDAGFSSFVKGFIGETTANGVLGELGFSAFAYGLKTVTDAAAFRIGISAAKKGTREGAPIAKSASFVLALADVGFLLRSTSATDITCTVPPNASVAFEVGTIIEGFQGAAGNVTIAPGSGVTLIAEDGKLTTASTGAPFSIEKVDTNTWLVAGSLVP